ncbi:MAG: PQQ-dependent sugar dehydrogenase, partial [Bacteroidetes bacterium]|nr:PQQ-dependent sugar dehydrogenase [Bacteroidota bacterium]
EPMELEVLPNRDIIFVERRGDMKLYSMEEKTLKTVAHLPITFELEDGLLGLALDPDYATNNWIYLFYSPEGDEPKQHVSRFVFKDGQLDMESEKVVLIIPTQRDQCCHSAGSLEFGPNGNLFISTGDNTSPRATGYAPADERDGRSPWDAQKSSGNTNDLRGKILRIHPEDDGTYTVPDGNLFAKDGSEGRPEIFVMGCRNPYRMSIDSKTGYLYWGEVGPDAGEDSVGKGPMGYDEVNQAKKAGFFGWPYFIADNKPYHEVDFATGTSSEKPFDPQNPVNNSPNNTGSQKLPPAQKAFIWYPYGPSSEFPLVGDGSRNAMAGPVFHYADYPDSEKKYPEYYDGKLFTYDWMRGWIMAVTMDNEGNFKKMERFLPSFTFNNLIDIVMGPDGDMFMLEYGTNWFSQNPDARLVHLQYVSGNRKPLAKIAADKTIGAAPLTINFNGETSKDFDGDPITYQWSFNGKDVQSEEANPSYTFNEPGTYKVKLTVSDPSGETSEVEQEILVGNELPRLSWELSGNRSFYFDNQTLNYAVSVTDAEDGSTADGSI